MRKLPHPIPYQGSKRALAPTIARFVPREVQTFYEPFAGSAAMTIYAATFGMAQRFVIADSLAPIIALWEQIVNTPEKVSDRYEEIWLGQTPENVSYFNEVRARYNDYRDSVDLLYLICRCVKNAVRFNNSGRFTQSHDKRRLGMQPDKMREAISGVSYLLKDKTEFRVGDWLATTSDATSHDFVYMDPPYFGTTVGPDKRYFQQLSFETLVSGLDDFRIRKLRFALSYDGMTGTKEYSPPLPDTLKLTRLLLHAGRSSQSTLSGRNEDTIESLYLSPGLSDDVAGIIQTKMKSVQELLL